MKAFQGFNKLVDEDISDWAIKEPAFPGSLDKIYSEMVLKTMEILNKKYITVDHLYCGCGWNRAEWWMMTADAAVATVLGSIPVSPVTMESEARQMKQCCTEKTIKTKNLLLFKQPACLHLLWIAARSDGWAPPSGGTTIPAPGTAATSRQHIVLQLFGNFHDFTLVAELNT